MLPPGHPAATHGWMGYSEVAGSAFAASLSGRVSVARLLLRNFLAAVLYVSSQESGGLAIYSCPKVRIQISMYIIVLHCPYCMVLCYPVVL